MTALAPTGVDIGRVQTIRKGCLLLTVATVALLFVFSASMWSAPARAAIQWAGVGLIFLCISGRTWCALYIGGRKTSELVTAGPYSVSRNPLYGFSIIGALGVGAQLGSLSVALLAGTSAWAIHLMVVLQEERVLLSQHRHTFQRYRADVPRFLPRFELWHDVACLKVRPHFVLRTFLDACFFLAAVPLALLFGLFQEIGLVPVLLRLP
jgi:protein-S-isoprenylcysteine O-methyltransferase Ste14